LDAALGKLGPYAFVAIALKVYVDPVVSPVTTNGEDAPEVNLTPQQANTV
jgi:hypothetical protein